MSSDDLARFVSIVIDDIDTLMFLHLVVELLLVNIHNVWKGDIYVIIITIFGWAALLKEVGYFMLPGSLTKDMMRSINSRGMIVFAALVSLVVGGLLMYAAYEMYLA